MFIFGFRALRSAFDSCVVPQRWWRCWATSTQSVATQLRHLQATCVRF